MTMSSAQGSSPSVPPAGAARPPLLEARNISKYFGAVVALEGVSLEVRAGEINCLLGDNGAGKSTLIKTLSGVHTPDEGTLAVDGAPVKFNAPRDALDAGIATVYQDLSVMPLMSISRNFFLGNEPVKGFGPFKRFDAERAAQVAREEMHHIGIDVRDTDQLVGHAVRWGAPDARHRPGRILRGARPHPRRTDLGPRRQGVGDRAPARDLGTQPGPRRDLHHPQRPARAADRRLVHDPHPRSVGRDVQARRARCERSSIA